MKKKPLLLIQRSGFLFLDNLFSKKEQGRVLTDEQIDHMIKQMTRKADEYAEQEVFQKLTPEAQEILRNKSDFRTRFHSYITDAFLEGVGNAMSYMVAVHQREDHKEDDA